MTIVDFISEGAKGKRATLLVTAAVAGVANMLALMIINSVAQAPETAGALTFLAFALVGITRILTMRHTLYTMNALIESALYRYKGRIIEKIGRTEFGSFEKIGSSEIFDRLTQSMGTLSTRASAVGSLLQSGCTFFFALIYLALLSPVVFAILGPLELIALYIYHHEGEAGARLVRAYTRARIVYLDMLMALLKGAKEIKLNQARRQEVVDDFSLASATLRDTSIKFSQVFADNLLWMIAIGYALVAILVFMLPLHVKIESSTLSTLVVVSLVLWGRIQEGVNWYPAYVQANQAVGDIMALEEKLQAATLPDDLAASQYDPWGGKPGRIEARKIQFVYPAENDDQKFRIGPIDLTIEAGEILFIIGGNGSGKSTLLKVLTGLYQPTQGVLWVGGVPLSPNCAQAYRELIAAIFSDFHLFAKVYGQLDADPETVKGLLRQMQIEHKTSFAAGQFTRGDLSTGQKKRLAMIVALLEDRPVFVLDEWAADQDPEFRKYFYESLLPALKRQGKTVIAVSHDERYYHCADRVVFMEDGAIRSVIQNSIIATSTEGR